MASHSQVFRLFRWRCNCVCYKFCVCCGFSAKVSTV